MGIKNLRATLLVFLLLGTLAPYPARPGSRTASAGENRVATSAQRLARPAPGSVAGSELKAKTAGALPATQAKTQKPVVAADLDQRLAKFQPVKMPFHSDGLTARQRQMVGKLVEASQYLEDIFWRQSDPEALTLYRSLAGSKKPEDVKLRRFLLINGSRFDLVDENKPFVGTTPMPSGRGLYSPGLTRESRVGPGEYSPRPDGIGVVPTNGLFSSTRSKRLPLMSRKRRSLTSSGFLLPASERYSVSASGSLCRQKMSSRYCDASTSFPTIWRWRAVRPSEWNGILTGWNFASRRSKSAATTGFCVFAWVAGGAPAVFAFDSLPATLPGE